MGMIGNSLAQGLISGANIQDGTVDTPDLKDSAVTAAKIANGVVTPGKLSTGAPTWDSSSNFGIGGATPSASTSNYRTLQIGVSGNSYSIFGQRVAGTSETFIGWNAYGGSNTSSLGSGFYYRTTGDAATLYTQNAQHTWWVAPTGTAGNLITFTQAMTLDTSGNWLLGTSTTLTKATIYGSGDQKLSLVSPTGSSTQVGINLSPSMTAAEAAANPAQAAIYATDSSYSANIIFANKVTGALGNALTERARFNTSGQLGVATTTPFATIAANTPNRNDGGSNSLGAIIAAGPISDAPSNSFASSTAIFRVHGSNATNNLQFGVGGNAYNYHPWIQASYDNSTPGSPNSGAKDLILQPLGGNLLVGTSSFTSGGINRTVVVSGSGSAGFQLASGTSVASYIYWYSNTGFRVETASSYARVEFSPGGSGGVQLTSGATSWTSLSDENTKTDLVPITNAAEKVATLRAVTGRFKTDEVGKSRAFLIAQDVLSVLPEAVTTYKEKDDDTDYLGLSYTEVIPLLVAAIKELNARITALEAA